MNDMVPHDTIVTASAVKSARKRAALFFYEGFIGISPSVIGAALELERRGYVVDLYYNVPAIDTILPTFPPNVRLHEHRPITRRITRPLLDVLRRRALHKLSKSKANNTVRQKSARVRALSKGLIALIELPQFAFYCRQRPDSIDIAIAFDMNSLAAMDFAIPKSVPLIYWSLEIMLLEDAPEAFSRWMKRHELQRLNDARAVVVQSEIRRALIEQDLGSRIERYVEVPNAPALPMPANLGVDFFSIRFPIAKDAWIVLDAGFISSSLLSLEIAQTVPSWRRDFVLVFHERQHRDPAEPYLQAVREAGGERTFLSLNPVPFDQVDTVYAGADIGIVCYQTAEQNEATAWASSGKLVYYLRHGLPIIIVTDKRPTLFDKWRCGVWVENVEGIKAALEAITDDYTNYSTGAKHAYAALYDFGAAFDRLMETVNGD
ncbi:MAG TPA: hypothetical protein VEH07_04580 [Alphaproteobacteria bacterium]|nr:hypothetical protein [Alphaproteobacteria bacterium]